MKAELHSSGSLETETPARSDALISDLEQAAASFEVNTGASFALFGARYEAALPDATAVNGQLADAACALLADVLYATLHCRRSSATSNPIILPRNGDAGASGFPSRLSRANCGTGAWHHGWQVREVCDDGMLCVSLDRLRLWASQQEFVADDGACVAGAIGRLRFPKEYLNLYPGHYVALGNAYSGQRDDTIRLYWNITADGAERLMARISETLNASLIAFQLKLLSDQQGYDRTDAAILYLPTDAWSSARNHVATIYAEMERWLKPQVSAYVLQLAPGLGLAEEPIEHVSFGQHRSRILAAGLNTAGESEDRLSALLHCVHAAGLDVEQFYLNPGSQHTYSPL